MRTLRWLFEPCRNRCVLASLVVIAAVGASAETPLVWQNRGQMEINGSALAIDSGGGGVVAAGNACTTPSLFGCNWFVRAIDAATGGTLWEDRRNVGAFDRSQSVVVHGNRAFASGWFGQTEFVVRAYDLRSGTSLWEQRISRLVDIGRLEIAEMVGARGDRVFAVGEVFNQTTSSFDFAVFAFDARTGELMWESVSDPSGLRLFDIAFALDGQGDRIFVSGPIANGSTILVRALDAKTGGAR